MTKKQKYIHIGILNYPDSQLSAIHGLTDMFLMTNKLTKNRDHAPTIFQVSHWSLDKKQQSVTPSYISTEPADTLNALIIPPSLEMQPEEEVSPAITQWLRDIHKQGSTLCSICIGAFVLAQSGLLNHRQITTHWALKDQFEQLFPDIDLNTDKLIVDDGDIITAGGLMAWNDLGLKLIKRFAGPTLMLDIARFFLIDPHGREQQFYNSFTPYLSHGDEAILKVQHWLQRHYHEKVESKDMASVSVLSERTFLRRFRKATTLNPSTYIQLLRIEKARELLELSTMPFNQITWQVGYSDAGAFHKLFQKAVGLTPGEYRQRFTVETK